jgi:hypothetical protein
MDLPSGAIRVYALGSEIIKRRYRFLRSRQEFSKTKAAPFFIFFFLLAEPY